VKTLSKNEKVESRPRSGTAREAAVGSAVDEEDLTLSEHAEGSGAAASVEHGTARAATVDVTIEAADSISKWI
jgi:hypothetical protein